MESRLPRYRTTPCRDRPPACRAAFTLVELLIVVAILALLITMLLPGLGAARESARRTKCASNLRQIAFAWRDYLSVSNGEFPLDDRFNNLNWFYGGKTQIYSHLLVGGRPAFDPRPLNFHVGLDPAGNAAAEIFHCPSDVGAENLPDPSTRKYSTYDYMGNSYMLNAGLLIGTGTPPDRLPVRAGLIKIPEWQFALTGDQQYFFTINNNRNFRARWHDRTGERVNLAFLDGHAAYTRLSWGRAYTPQYSFELQRPEHPDGPEADATP